MKTFAFAVSVLSLAGTCDAFAPPSHRKMDTLSKLSALPTPEESAKALSDYMAKAHETKLKAIQDVETKKDAEISALKAEIQALKNAPPSLAAAPSAPMLYRGDDESVETLKTKLVAYQQFISKYIVEAQQQKLEAVHAAEAALTKKHGLLLAADPAAPPAPTSKENSLYQERNENVKAAGAAGKSRWSEAELQRSSTGIGAAPESPSAAINGAPEPVAAPVLSEKQILYQQRNAMVSAAAKAGKSRWGEMEIEKATKLAAEGLPAGASLPTGPTITVTPEIEAADHGMRADGGVSGPTLAERVNLGAMLVAR